MTAHKPISGAVQNAVKELVNLTKQSPSLNIPDSTISSLSKRIGVFLSDIRGSLSDMQKFRKDILSMMQKHGPPSFFLTLSSADSLWPEGFVEALNASITLSEARTLSSKQRAYILAQNPVRKTMAWKRRVQAFLDFILEGESKPLGTISHYVQKAKWQGRLSEHVHFLFWAKRSVPELKIKQ